MRVLITGFEPFGSHTTNPSQIIVESLQQSLSFERIEFEFEVLEVSKTGSHKIASSFTPDDAYDLVIHLGLCESCQDIRVETRAADRLDMRIPDNEGRQIADSIIDGDGYVYSELPLHHLIEDADRVIESIDAGTFICNETYRQTLLAFDRVGLRRHCVFLHLPPFETLPLQKSLALVTSMIMQCITSLQKSTIDVAALALLSEQNEVFTAHRVGSTISGWEFPGGKFESTETALQTIEREIFEELNVEIKGIKTVGRWDVDIKGRTYSLYLTHAVLNGKGTKNLELREHSATRWVSPSEFESIPWLPHDVNLARYLSKIIPNL